MNNDDSDGDDDDDDDHISYCHECSVTLPEKKMTIDEYGFIYCNNCIIEGSGKFLEQKRQEIEDEINIE
jgi:hypothetical protein